ncbi:MAG: hypothetical protein RMJ03_06420 [Nitrososphaerota archaeon]|nr:hypothetical protein [Nitrososphaerota archaeon]
MLEVFKALKHRWPSKIYCPICGSPKIRLSSSLDYWLTPKKYICENCGYYGSIIMELELKEKRKRNLTPANT